MLINSDYKDLKFYFQKMIELSKQIQEENSLKTIEQYQNDSYDISHYTFPDAVVNIYSFLEFHLKSISNQITKHYDLSFNDIKGDSELDRYNKYFTKYLGLDLNHIQNEYQQLNKLREFRNIFIHHGSYVKKKKKEIDKLDYLNGKKISGITITILKFTEPQPNDEVKAIITIHEEYIFDRLKDAKNYLENVHNAMKQVLDSRIK